MALTKRLNLGTSPRVEVQNCEGHLEVRGTSRPEVVIEGHDPETSIDEQEGRVVINSPGNCSIRLPDTGQLIVGHVMGTLQLKDLSSAAEVGQVDGHVSARRTSGLIINSVSGELRGRDMQGDLTVGDVSGHVTLKDIERQVRIEVIEGHFYGSNIPAGLHLGRVEGNFSLRSDFHPGSVSDATVDGHASFSIPENTNIQFRIRAEGKVRVEQGMNAIAEGRQRIVTLGNGEATFDVVSDGSVSIKYWDYYASDEEAPFVFEDLSSQLDDDFERLGASFKAFETTLHQLPDHIRGRVARKLDYARQRMEEAQRRVEKSVRSAGRDVGAAAMGGMSRVDLGGQEPVTEEERLLILKMLEEKKISVQEAEKLLTALEGRGQKE